jgi:hypothetical protein
VLLDIREKGRGEIDTYTLWKKVAMAETLDSKAAELTGSLQPLLEPHSATTTVLLVCDCGWDIRTTAALEPKMTPSLLGCEGDTSNDVGSEELISNMGRSLSGLGLVWARDHPKGLSGRPPASVPKRNPVLQ